MAFQALPPEQRSFAGLAKLSDDDDEVRHRLCEIVRFGLQLFNIPEQVRSLWANAADPSSMPAACPRSVCR